MTPCPYTNSYTDYPNHFEPFFDNGADSNCANVAEFTVPQIQYPTLCREINRLSAINSNPDSFSEQNTSDFTFVSNGNSTENSAPLVYANLETVNSVYPAQERLNYSFNSASKYNSYRPQIFMRKKLMKKMMKKMMKKIKKQQEIEAPVPNPPTKKRGTPTLSPTTKAVRIANAKDKKMNNKKSKIK